LGTTIARSAEPPGEYQGVLDGAEYEIVVPPKWNGGLVMFAHGYQGEGPGGGLAFPEPLDHYLTDQGYAWASSGYRSKGYRPDLFLLDLLALRAHPEKIARFDAKEVAALMNNPGIIRNRAKIEGTVASARVWLEIEAREGFSNFLWKFFDGRPQQNGFHSRAQIPAQSPKSVALSKGLKERGFKFCGPTIVYAFCQATGMVNDHLVSCWRHDACAALAYSPARPAANT
jgi:hypothetical protein